MPCSNVGGVDRALRAVVGPQTPWGWIGLVPLLTAVVGFCPAYTLFGVKTCRAARP